MSKKFKVFASLALVFCLSTLILFDSTLSVQAASKKTFTKTITIPSNNQATITFQVGKTAPNGSIVKAKVTAQNHPKDMETYVTMSGYYDGKLVGKAKKVSVKGALYEGENALYITNYSASKIKIKVKVSSDAKLKFKSAKTLSDGEGIG